MDFPRYIPLGPWKVHPHAFFETLAYFVGGQLFWRLRKRWGDALEGSTRLAVVAGAVLGAGIGAKLLHALTWLPAWREAGWGVVLGGKTVAGALLGGLLGVEIAKRRVGETRRTGDLFVLPLCVGMALGRLGCFFTGLDDGTQGGPTALPWGVDFGDGIPRHPASLYEVLVLALLAAWALRMRGRLRSGDLFRGFLGFYLLWRLLVDGLKGDPALLLHLTAIQWACLLGLVFLRKDLPRAWGAAPAAETV